MGCHQAEEQEPGLLGMGLLRRGPVGSCLADVDNSTGSQQERMGFDQEQVQMGKDEGPMDLNSDADNFLMIDLNSNLTDSSFCMA
ncbi:hypothetical protein CB1_000884038 [Camelus ferus]|nr:hypothetical protein CB1_000884038 [Camelus ferus]